MRCHRIMSEADIPLFRSACYSPQRMRRGRWSPELQGTEWPALHLQTDDCLPMSGAITEQLLKISGGAFAFLPTSNLISFSRGSCLKAKILDSFCLYCNSIPDIVPHYLDRGDRDIVECRRPLGWDAHFHIAERFSRRMQQHIAGDSGSSS